jgi:hypothetical protein
MSQTAQTPSRSAFPAVVAILGAFLIFYFLLNATYLNSDDKSVEPTIVRPSLAEHQGAAANKLAGYSVIDAAAGKVRLPIARAKALIVSENSK